MPWGERVAIPGDGLRVRSLAIALAFGCCTGAWGQGAGNPVRSEPSYIFATVLGSGVYDVGDGQITVVRLPFEVTLREESLDCPGWRLLLPLSVGYVSIDPDDPIDRWLPKEASTLSLVPGLEYRMLLREGLWLKPFGQLGIGCNFRDGDVSGLAVGGARVLWQIKPCDPWLLQFGSSLQWAGEWREGGGENSGFGLFELGADFRRDLPWNFRDRRWSGSVYLRWQHFFDVWNVASTPAGPIEVSNLYEVGLSLGVDREFEVLGFGFDRVTLGWVTGGDVNAFTIGTSFPF